MHMPSFHTVQLDLYGLLPLFRINFFPLFFQETTELFANNILKKLFSAVRKPQKLIVVMPSLHL